MTITCLLTIHPERTLFARGWPQDKPISPRPPDTPVIDRQCLFPSKHHDASSEAGPDDITFEELQALKTMAGMIVTPADALMRFHHYTSHFLDDYALVCSTLRIKRTAIVRGNIRCIAGVRGSGAEQTGELR